jgi:hypothetical protein
VHHNNTYVQDEELAFHETPKAHPEAFHEPKSKEKKRRMILGGGRESSAQSWMKKIDEDVASAAHKAFRGAVVAMAPRKSGCAREAQLVPCSWWPAMAWWKAGKQDQEDRAAAVM